MAVIWRSWTPLLALLVLYTLFGPAEMVKHENFKTCDESGFCKRNRAFAETVGTHGTSWTSPYDLDPASITLKDGVLNGLIIKSLSRGEGGGTVELPLTMSFLESGAVRVTIDESKRRQKKDVQLRHDSKARIERYDEVSKWAIVGGLTPNKAAATNPDAASGQTKVVWGSGGNLEAIITHRPFAVEFKRDKETHIKLNDRGYLNYEHWRPKVDEEGRKQAGHDEETLKAMAEMDESTWWEESFGGRQDTKTRGPESVGLDFSFVGYEHVYGIPSHAAPLSLRETGSKEPDNDDKFEDPYRLYNADVFEYELNSPMTLYGAIPYMQAHRKGSTVGMFWMNAAETWVDVKKLKSATNKMSLGIKGKTDTQTHWFSESGLLDVFIMLGPTPQAMAKWWGELTGYSQLPPQFSIAYHQCRWNYVTDEDVRDVDRKFDKANIPYDVIWLDIEYTDGKKYFTWDPLTFKDPEGMHKQLDEHQRKLVAIIDPHIKNVDDYPVVSELKSKDLTPHNAKDEQYEGWCWPGSSYWLDGFNPAAIKWWISLFKYDKFKGSAPNTHIWNDMNEPSVFNGPETTMPKDNLHYGNWEHRDIHNLNGLTFHNATYQALLDRDGAKTALARKRPFVLTRSFYAGSQRVGAMWTGDNQAEWGHLEMSLPMILSQGVSGFPFAGADIGGFFGNPSKDLLTRWYQAGIFYPFMRAHAHIDTRRREPYLLGEPYQSIITQMLRLRYSLLPAWYTAFHTAHTEGEPIVRPNWYVHPSDEKGFGIDDQMYLADTGLLVKPVTREGETSVNVYIADAAPYYDYFDFTPYTGSAGRTHTIDAPLEKLPLLMQAGHVIPRRDRPRRSSGLMKWDPFTLVLVLDASKPQGGEAHGELYLDDGESFAYTEGAYVHRRFVYTDGALQSEDLMHESARQSKQASQFAATMKDVQVEKVIIVGAPAAWKDKRHVKVVEEGSSAKGKSTASTDREATLTFHAAENGRAAWAVVRKPAVSISSGWKIDFS